MFTLLLILLVAGLTLAVVFYVGGLFLQGFFYTVPSEQLYWQAPASAGVLTVFLALWCLMIANSQHASPSDIPYDTIFRFSPKVDMLKEPPRELWAVKKSGEMVYYKRKRDELSRYVYENPKYLPARPWNGDNIAAIMMVVDNEKQYFQSKPVEQGAYRIFVNEKGWVIHEFDQGPDAIPVSFRWGRLFWNLVLNITHFALWFVCLWLIMRFQWGHALGLAIAAWALFTLALLPMLLTYAAEVAQRTG